MSVASPDTDVLVSFRGVQKSYDGENLIVKHLDLDIRRGEFLTLLGPSGSGKTTCLMMLAGFETPTAGEIRLDGKLLNRVPPHKRNIGMVFQNYALFPHMTVGENLAYPLKIRKLPAAEVDAKVKRALGMVKLDKFANRYPGQMSGGQQQRVALARALVFEPQLVLMDEPLGALDKKLRQQTQLELVNMIEQVGVTCIMVTHDQEEAMTMASRVGIMSEGQLLQVASPSEIYERPNCRFTAEFIGETNLFSGQVAVDEADHVQIDSAELRRPIYVGHGITGTLGMPVWVSLRPERVGLSRSAPAGDCNHDQGTVHDIAYLGGFSIYHIQLASGKIVKASVPATRWRDEPAPTWGESVHLSWADNDAVVLTL